MESLRIECLRCGATRDVARSRGRIGATEECARCRYVGWAPTADLSEAVRRMFRERPLERRRLYAV